MDRWYSGSRYTENCCSEWSPIRHRRFIGCFESYRYVEIKVSRLRLLEFNRIKQRAKVLAMVQRYRCLSSRDENLLITVSRKYNRRGETRSVICIEEFVRKWPLDSCNYSAASVMSL